MIVKGVVHRCTLTEEPSQIAEMQRDKIEGPQALNSSTQPSGMSPIPGGDRGAQGVVSHVIVLGLIKMWVLRLFMKITSGFELLSDVEN